jgi:hypothetical protein
MSTTNLFVELIVIGVGAACWALPLLALALSLGCGLAWWRLLDTELRHLHDLHERTTQPAGEVR